MASHVALLHSIVLSPGRRVVMAELRAMAEALGFSNPRTLVSTGNLVFDADADADANGDCGAVGEIEAALEAGFRRHFGRPVDSLVRSADDWRRLAAGNPFATSDAGHVTVRVMRAPLPQAAFERLCAVAAPGLRLALVDGDPWIDFSGAPDETRLAGHLTTKKLGIGTLRNANTVNGLCAMLG
ncbi:DUF1697 domain-containing protein [Rhizobium sp. TRM95111]|uniref:DUF1697 domain-containing protein n=1 Tax=Rhizobium alarense TaxID=2846851 RepID=UPI001F20EE0F|nr:DUF1697 domain-containing protein [Rhizobium alarense]MCF3639787.1 DUF1697 domain-containing protein [Rhizobium alarense]